MSEKGLVIDTEKISEEVLNVNVLPTRRCNLRCGYCKIWKPSSNNSSAFRDELSWEEWKDITEHIWDLTQGFISYAGGETLMTRGDIVDFTRFLNKKDIFYAYVSNSTLMNEELARDLVDAGLWNWSVSADFQTSDPDNNRKNEVGLYWLDRFRELGVDDLMAITVITNENIDNIEAGVKDLSSKGIWSTVTLLDWISNEHYDFTAGESDLIPDENKVKKLCDRLKEMKKDGYLLHDPLNYYEIIPNYVKKPYFCKKPWGSLTIDADGKLRLCYRIRGREVPKFSAMDLGKKDKEILEAYKHDYAKLCDGCSWECTLHSDLWILNGGIENGKKQFQHSL